MTRSTLHTEGATSPLAETMWHRSAPPKKGEGRCICCPEQPSHVFAYSIKLADPAGLSYNRTNINTLEPTGFLDTDRFIEDAIASMPEGTRFRISITVDPES